MKPTLQFKLSQHLTLTPQLQQSIRLLQLSTIELNQEIERLLMENPMLEREEVARGDLALQSRSKPPDAVRASAAEAAHERTAGRSSGIANREREPRSEDFDAAVNCSERVDWFD